MQLTPEVTQFLQNLLREAGIVDVDDDTKQEMVNQLAVRLDTFISQKIIENLPEDKYAAFIKMNEEQKPQAEIEEFLKTSIPDVQQLLAASFAEFRDMYIGNVAVNNNSPKN